MNGHSDDNVDGGIDVDGDDRECQVQKKERHIKKKEKETKRKTTTKKMNEWRAQCDVGPRPDAISTLLGLPR